MSLAGGAKEVLYSAEGLPGLEPVYPISARPGSIDGDGD
jgi:hypothetical protein